VSEKKLTAKQLLFCHEYLKDLNATQAAIRAGYSENTARQIGADNLSKMYIKQYIQELQSETFESIDQKIKENYEFMQSVRDDDEERTENRIRASELMGKHLGMFRERMEITGKDGSPVEVAHYDLDKLTTQELKQLEKLARKA